MSLRIGDLEAEAKRIAEAFSAAVEAAHDSRSLEQCRVEYLGKKSAVANLMKGMGQLGAEERPVFGQIMNALRQQMEGQLGARASLLHKAEEEARMAREAIDISLRPQGTAVALAHPIQQVIDRISEIFIGMGYSIAEGPELELVRNNFDFLRIPEGHPSREERDTFYIDDEHILRTQTSGVQVRVMQETQPPIRIICPGKVYRPDTADATHSPIFHQIEGLVVDEGISMADLVGTLQTFAKELFGADCKIRLRPHHFPFTEPSCEVDVTCWRCGGKGCPTCKGEGYVEILGAGMVHPWVLENAGIDPKRYSGFAFGIGAERTAMARFDVADIRSFYENNVEFLKQF